MKLITKKLNHELIEITKIALLQNKRQLLKEHNQFKRKEQHIIEQNADIELIPPLKEKTYQQYRWLERMDYITETANSLNASKRAKKKRIKKRLEEMINENEVIYWITITYTDKQLNKSSEKWRRKEITQILKKNKDYIANIDYGDTNEREHYHIITTEKIKWKKGYIKTKIIRTDEKSKRKLSNYMAKLTAHAVKDSTIKGTKTPSILYKRKTKKERELPF